MKKLLKLSVIVANYNSEKTISSVLKAIIKCKPFEVIVVDDYSSDKSIEIIKKFPVKLFRNEYNLGPAKTRNRGAFKAKGNFLLFIDSDVVIPNNAIKRVMQNIKSYDKQITTAMPKPSSDYSNLCSKHFNWRISYNYSRLPSYIDFIYGSFFSIPTDVFLSIGCFNNNYKKNDLEDNEFGYRLHKQNFKIYLDKSIKLNHKKNIGLFGLLKNDFIRTLGRVKLIKTKKVVVSTNRLISTPAPHVISPIFCFITLLCLIIGCFYGAIVSLATFIILYLDYLLFVSKVSKIKEVLMLVPLLFIDMFVVGVAVIYGFIKKHD